MTAIYIGVMTGTSMDGVDLVAASFDPLQLHATLTLPFDPDLRDELMALTLPGDNEIDRMGKADVALATMIGHGINSLIEKNKLDKPFMQFVVNIFFFESEPSKVFFLWRDRRH